MIHLPASAARLLAAYPGTYDINHETGEQTWSPELKALFGLPENAPADFELLFKHVHPEDRRSVVAAILRALRPDGPGRFAIEHRIVRTDGEIRWVYATGHTQFHGEGAERRPSCAIGMVSDITRQKEAELVEEAAFA